MTNQISKILPFLSEYIDEDTAKKAIAKVAPKIGKFLETGIKKGLPLATGLAFLRNQVIRQKPRGGSESPVGQRSGAVAAQSGIERNENFNQNIKNTALAGLGLAGGAAGLIGAGLNEAFTEPTPQEQALSQTGENQFLDPSPLGARFQPDQQGMRTQFLKPQSESAASTNPLQYLNNLDPKLAQFIEANIGQGRTPKEAGALAKTSQYFDKSIKKAEKETKENFVDLVERLFSNSKQKSKQENTRQEALGKFNQKKSGLMDEERQRFQQAYPQAQQQAQQGQGGSQGDQAIIAALQKILSM